MQRNKRLGGLLGGRSHSGRLSANRSLASRMPLINPFMSKSLIGGIVVFAVAFFAAFYASSVLTPVNTSDATDLITANLQSQEYYVKISSSDVAMNLITTPTGAMTVVNSTVKTATNSPSGYKLYLGMSPYNSSGTEKSSADKQKNGLYLGGDLSRTDGAVIAGVSGTGGTSGTPAALTDNTWGYAIDKNTTGVPDIWKNEDHTTMSSATPTNDKFAAVPTVGNEELIQTTNTNNVSWDTPESSIDFTDPSTYTTASVYYGIRGTVARPSGAYSNTVAYTAVAQAAPDAGSISFDPVTYTRDATYESMVWDDRVRIMTTLYTNMEDLGTATVKLSGGPENAQNLTCTDPVLTSVNNLLNITCTLPQAYAGNYKVSVHLDKFGQDYTGDYTYAATWDTISAMQEMTSTICAEPQTPNTTAASSSTTLPAAQFDGTVVPEKFLTDLRGGGGHITGNFQSGYGYQEAYTGKYRIRKLADGNCWMTENMDLPFGSTSTFYSYDTNLTAIPDSTITESGTYGTYTDTDGIISWTPKNVVDTSTCTTGAADCDPNTTGPATSDSWCYNTNGGPIDTNTKNAHNYQGPGCTHAAPGTLSGKTINDNDGNVQGVGTYFNWAASTAQSEGSYDDGDAINSICPKGWRLPIGGESSTAKSFVALMNAYNYNNNSAGSAAARKFPVSLAFSGLYNWGGGYLYTLGGNGVWWTSSPYDRDGFAYILDIDSSLLDPSWRGGRTFGFSLRCVQN